MMLGSSLKFSFFFDSNSSNKQARDIQRGAFDLWSCVRNSCRALALPAEAAPSPDLRSGQSRFLYVGVVDPGWSPGAHQSCSVTALLSCTGERKCNKRLLG